MQLISIFKYNPTGEYHIPSLSYNERVEIKGVILSSNEYEINGDVLKVLKDHSSNVTINYLNDKQRLIGFSDKYIFNFNDEKSSLSDNSRYRLSFLATHKLEVEGFDSFELYSSDSSSCGFSELQNAVYVENVDDLIIDFETKLSPNLCLPRDVKKLLGNAILDVISPDIELFIYETSLDINSDDKFKSLTEHKKKNLCSNKAALDIMYQFYYHLTEEMGTNEDTVGTLKFKKQRTPVSIDSLIKRFKDNIKDLEGQDNGDGSVASFTKAKSAEHPAGSRLW